MTAEITGMGDLNKRLSAISNGRTLLQKMQLEAVANAKRLVPRKTGNLGRSIHPGSVSARDAFVWAGAGYAAYVELGTRAHDIVPRNAQALRFPARGTSTTLGGRVRSSAARTPGAYAFAKRVRHPGTKAQPFLVPGAKKAVDDNGVDIIIELWNGAA